MRRLLLVVVLVLAGCSSETPISGPSLIAFQATWCQTCQRDEPVLERIEAEFPVTRIDFEQDRRSSTQYHVCYIPTYIVLNDGEEILRTLNVHLAFDALRTLQPVITERSPDGPGTAPSIHSCNRCE